MNRKRLILFFFVLTAILLSAEQQCGYRVERVSVPLQWGDSAAAYLLIPDSLPEKGAPSVLVLHDHGAHFSIGKEKMVCPLAEESLSIREDAVAWVQKYYDGAFLGDSLARAGYVVLSMDALYWGERAICPPRYQEGKAVLKQYNHLLRDYQPAFYWQTLAVDTIPWGERMLQDDQDAVSYLASLPCVDPHRIACVGFSMGAYRAWNLAASDPRLAVCVAAHWMTTIRRNGGTLPNASSYSMYIPSRYPVRDYPEVAAQIAPRPFLLIYGMQDPLFPVPAVLEADSVIRRSYDAAGAEDKYLLISSPSAHRFISSERQALISFLKKAL